jgi:predicted nuclease of predicted toxin-antitoxin system
VRFLLDECADARIRPFLQEMGHDVRAIAHDYPASLVDPEVLNIAFQTGRILIAHDRGFGELIFVKHRPHSGVILLRLGPMVPLATIVSRLDHVLSKHAHELDQFIVVTPNLIRVRR